MKIAIIGGTFGEAPRKSGVITKLHNQLNPLPRLLVNGGTIEELNNINLKGYDLILWMAKVDNETPKNYPVKDKGSVMIVSKVLGNGRTEVDAISRIFMMRGNAVIGINTTENGFNFKLMDALGNVWVDTSDLEMLVDRIFDFLMWTNKSERIGTTKYQPNLLEPFIELNKKVADKFEAIKGRYFGNASTRCSLMFPGMRGDNDSIYVSRRNSSKKRLAADDMVIAFNDEEGNLRYLGDNKPSVDTPIQLRLFEEHPSLNYMIHGHTYVRGGEFTKEYFPCGDMREFDEVNQIMSGATTKTGVVNLKNHGFLLYAETITEMKLLVNNLAFIEREVGFEKV